MADALLERLGGELVARLAETLEIGNETARLVIDASGAALVAALAQQASAPGGSARITRLLEAAEGSPDAVLARLLDSDDAAGTETAAAVLGTAEAPVAAYLAGQHVLSPRQAQRALDLLAGPMLALIAAERETSASGDAAIAARLISERDRLAASGAGILVAAAQPGTVRALPDTFGDEGPPEEDRDRWSILAALWRKRIVWPLAALFALLGVALALLLGELTGGGEATVEPPPSPPPAAAPEAAPELAPAPPPPAAPDLTRKHDQVTLQTPWWVRPKSGHH